MCFFKQKRIIVVLHMCLMKEWKIWNLLNQAYFSVLKLIQF
jgi:hypothetical protein